MSDLMHVTLPLLLALTLPGTLYLLLLSIAGSLPARKPRGTPMGGRIAIVVPAHDEAAGIGRTLNNLLALARQDGDCEVVVIADNCTDATATIAREAGARVLERHDTTRRGKGYALDFAFRTLLGEASSAFAAFVVIDADSVADAGLLASLRAHFGAGADVLQSRYTVLNADASPRTQLAEIALAAFNVLRPRGRDRLGLSAGILGNGFALRREVVEAVPYGAASVVEDLEYHLHLIAAGYRVGFVNDATVRGEMPTGDQGRYVQRARWEGGRLRMLAERGPRLARELLCGRWHAAEPLAELILPPLAYHVLILLALGAAAALAQLTGALGVVLASLAVVMLHVLIALRVASLPWRRLAVLVEVPRYLWWKVGMMAATLGNARRGSAWVRTDRKGQ